MTEEELLAKILQSDVRAVIDIETILQLRSVSNNEFVVSFFKLAVEESTVISNLKYEEAFSSPELAARKFVELRNKEKIGYDYDQQRLKGEHCE